jgi:AcrR family transcriptional regulator
MNTSDAATPSLRADAQRNRERILAAAADLFGARGLDVSMEDIAHAAGVGVGTLYRRFRNRDELIDALFESRLAEFDDLLHECAAQEDGWTALVTLIERLLDAQAADRGLKHLFHSRMESHAEVADVQGRVLDTLTQCLARGQASGQIRADISAMDVVLVSFQVGVVADLTAEADPGAWRRALAIALDALQPGAATSSELPGAPIERDTLERALQCWRPPVPKPG